MEHAAENAPNNTKPTLLERINNVRRKINYVQKDKTVSAGASGSYKAATHDAVIGQVRQHLIDEGIVILQTLITGTSLPYEVNADMTRAKQFRYEATYEIRFINVDDAEDNFAVIVQSHAMDNADKAPGKAMSYAKKYAILKTFDIETGEDEESRYQNTDLDVAGMVRAIGEAADPDQLKTLFNEFRDTCKRANNADAYAEVIKATNEKKASFQGGKK